MRHAPVFVERSDGEAGDLVAPEPVVEEDGEEGPVAPRLEAAPLRSAEQPAWPGRRRVPVSGLRSRSPSWAASRPRQGSRGRRWRYRGSGRARTRPRGFRDRVAGPRPRSSSIFRQAMTWARRTRGSSPKRRIPSIDMNSPTSLQYARRVFGLSTLASHSAAVAPYRQLGRRLPRACRVQLRCVHARILLPIMYRLCRQVDRLMRPAWSTRRRRAVSRSLSSHFARRSGSERFPPAHRHRRPPMRSADRTVPGRTDRVRSRPPSLGPSRRTAPCPARSQSMSVRQVGAPSGNET